MTFTVGFDLDMTLTDPRRGIAALYAALSEELGIHIDGEVIVTRLGPPLEDELINWMSAEQIPLTIERYRARYDEIAGPLTTVMPGATRAVDAVHAAGGRVVVVTAKEVSTATDTLDRVGIAVDHVYGEAWAEVKGDRLRDADAQVMVGDHVGDMIGAKVAGVQAVGVTTGPCDADMLTAAGADAVLADLHGFPDWLTAWNREPATRRRTSA